MKSIFKRDCITYHCNKKDEIIVGKLLVSINFLDYINIISSKRTSPTAFVSLNEDSFKIVQYIIKNYNYCNAKNIKHFNCFYLTAKVRCHGDEYDEVVGKRILERKIEKRLMKIEIAILKHIRKQFKTHDDDIYFRIDQIKRNIEKCDEMV